MAYPWKRFWCPRDGRINFDQYSGYPYDPEGEWSRLHQEDFRSLDQIEEAPCLVMLGEPGIGKSRAVDECKTTYARAGHPCLYLNLRAYDSGGLLAQDLFQDTSFQSWRAGTGNLTILLDSLDECLIRVGTVASLLHERLSRCDVSRLRLRIACRTAVWPESFTGQLAQLWGEANVSIYELTPLCARNVRDAATAEGMDPDAFLSEISRVRAQPWAIKPITLRFLISSFKREGRLAATETELYRAGCQELCRETQERRDARVPLATDEAQRYAIASRLAAVSLICNRTAIWKATSISEMPTTDVSVTSIVAGTEIAHGREFSLDQKVIEETLDTGLFTARGPHRMGFAHQTYAEFLAADYLNNSNLTPDEIMSLITDGEGDGRRVIPQLGELAARLATLKPDVFDRLIHSEPALLLRSDVATAGDARRERLVAALLEAARRRELKHDHMSDNRWLRHLKHPRLAAQLRPVLAAAAPDQHAMYLALHIGVACELPGLDKSLLKIALNRKAEIRDRYTSIAWLSKTASIELRKRLLPLTMPSADDPNDNVAGAAFDALWPDCISADELFKRLYPVRNTNHFGMYSHFTEELPDTLRPEHLPAALRWVMRQRAVDSLSPTAKLAVKIIRVAWNHINHPGVLEFLASAHLHFVTTDHGRMAHYSREGGPVFATDAVRRRLLIDATVPLLSQDQHHDFHLLAGTDPLVLSADFLWLLERGANTPDPLIAARYFQLAARYMHPSDTEKSDAILDLASKNELARKTFAWLIGPVDLNSEQANTARKHFKLERELAAENREPPTITPPPRERVLLWLNRCEAGEPQHWWCLARELSLTPASRDYDCFDKPDITEYPGWKDADETTRARIIASARRYIVAADDARLQWLNTNTVFYSAIAGYLAFRLLWTFDRPYLLALAPADWNRWFAALLRHTANMSDDEISAFCAPILAAGRAASPGGFAEAFAAILRHDARDGSLTALHRVQPILDSSLLAHLRDLAWASDLVENGAIRIIGFLAENGDRATLDRGFDLIPSLPTDPAQLANARESKIVCAVASHVDSSTWPRIWPAFKSNVELAKLIVIGWATGHRFAKSNFLTHLADSQVADLYIWVERHFPSAEYTPPRGTHSIDERENINIWHGNSVLHELNARHTAGACQELKRIRDELPQLPWLSNYVRDAADALRAHLWQPRTVQELLHFFRSNPTNVKPVAATAAPAKRPPKKAGRPRMKTATYDKSLMKQWNAAHAADPKLTEAEFAKSKDITPRDFHLALRRARAREREMNRAKS